jgi:hypothetical protein
VTGFATVPLTLFMLYKVVWVQTAEHDEGFRTVLAPVLSVEASKREVLGFVRRPPPGIITGEDGKDLGNVSLEVTRPARGVVNIRIVDLADAAKEFVDRALGKAGAGSMATSMSLESLRSLNAATTTVGSGGAGNLSDDSDNDNDNDNDNNNDNDNDDGDVATVQAVAGRGGDSDTLDRLNDDENATAVYADDGAGSTQHIEASDAAAKYANASDSDSGSDDGSDTNNDNTNYGGAGRGRVRPVRLELPGGNSAATASGAGDQESTYASYVSPGAAAAPRRSSGRPQLAVEQTGPRSCTVRVVDSRGRDWQPGEHQAAPLLDVRADKLTFHVQLARAAGSAGSAAAGAVRGGAAASSPTAAAGSGGSGGILSWLGSKMTALTGVGATSASDTTTDGAIPPPPVRFLHAATGDVSLSSAASSVHSSHSQGMMQDHQGTTDNNSNVHGSSNFSPRGPGIATVGPAGPTAVADKIPRSSSFLSDLGARFGIGTPAESESEYDP